MASQEDHSVPDSSIASAILQPGKNCWRIERASRFGLLIDGDAYFRAVRNAIVHARHSVFILSWDIDSRMRLVPQGANDGFPEPLAEFLEAVVAARPQLHVYVLNWDFAMLYALEREHPDSIKLRWRTKPRLQFCMDGRHPVGASHHQKVVTVDDAVAFVGGLDLTRCRWDTPEHACKEPLRCDPDGKPYAPFHDVQAVVDGAAARALGELARERWHRATGRKAVGLCDIEADPWPVDTQPDLTDVDVAIARTEPTFEDDPGVFEVRQLHLDAIAAAKRHLFFESQYFTSGLVAGALASRLQEDDGPEVLIVSPDMQCGWLEEATMGVLRSRVHRQLRASDHHGRYAMSCPAVPGLDTDCLNVHSKVFTVDDILFGIGSANLSNRSMSLDTECHLAIEAKGPQEEQARIRTAIASMRNRLLAEHLGTEPETVGKGIAEQGSLLRVVDMLRREGRHLKRFEPSANADLDALMPTSSLIDPEEPIDADFIMSELLPHDSGRKAPGRLAALGMLALGLATLAVIWHWTPLREWVNLDALVSIAQYLDALPFSPLVIVAAYAIASVLMVPVTLLIAVIGIVFGPVEGAVYAITGTLTSAALSYAIGWKLGRDAVRRLVGPRINRLSQRVARQGILAMMVVRFLPVAPFTMVNVIAGASHIRFRDYMIGTGLGMTPGIVITVTFVHHLVEALRSPTPASVGMLVLVVALLITLALGLQRLVGRRAQ
jgi:phosphatidylserine/phosphatidylglycerophosphate/cardiolipin synthase-like enzyme/uncharacterized membrane protein YdjX (TVP38/TMEM64 family)